MMTNEMKTIEEDEASVVEIKDLQEIRSKTRRRNTCTNDGRSNTSLVVTPEKLKPQNNSILKEPTVVVGSFTLYKHLNKFNIIQKH